MQFGHVLAFATAVLAAPAPVQLEDRQVNAGGGVAVITASTLTLPAAGTATPTATLNPAIASSVNKLANNAGTSVLLVGTSLVSFANSASSVATFVNSAVSSAASLILKDVNDALANALAVAANLAPVETAASSALSGLLSDILTILKQNKNAVIQVDNNIVNAVSLLVTNIKAAKLDTLATVTVTAAVSGVDKLLKGETKALTDTLNAVVALAQPFAQPLQSVQAILNVNAVGNLVPLADVYNALSMFVGSIPGAATPIVVV